MSSFSGGQTVSAAFCLKFGNDSQGSYSDKKRAELREALSELKLIIIDEISLISSDLLYKLDKKLKEIFVEKNKTPFGGIGLMLVGDLLQLPPVKGVYIFQEPKDKIYRAAYDTNDLWKNFQPRILKHNHRQGAGCEWANILNRFREGIVIEKDLIYLKKRETDDPHLDLDAMHLCYKNQETQNHNDKMLTQLVKGERHFQAGKEYPKGRKPYVKPDGRIEDLNVLDVLKVKIGARVLMVFNVNTIDDLVNGSTGTVIAFDHDKKTKQDCIIVKFDKESMGSMQRSKYPHLAGKYASDNGTPVFRQQMETMGKTKQGIQHGFGTCAKVYQFPLIINYASTNHKIQVS